MTIYNALFKKLTYYVLLYSWLFHLNQVLTDDPIKIDPKSNNPVPQTLWLSQVIKKAF